jgi:hypothetical protein
MNCFHKTATMSLSQDIAEITAGLATLLFLLTKLGPVVGKDQVKVLTLVFLTAVVAIVEAVEDAQRQEEWRLRGVVEATIAVCTEDRDRANRKRSRLARSDYDQLEEGRLRRECRHNHARAREAVRQDWIGTDCTFSDRQFEQTFRLTRRIVERLIQACGNHEPRIFGRDVGDGAENCAGKPCIAIEVKVLGVLKLIAYGNASRSYMDYHQMATNTFTEALKGFFRAVRADKELQGHFMRAPDAQDVKRITEQHERIHGVPGMLGSIDCLHVYWKNCPVGWQGQFKNGRYKYSSVVVEAMVDHNLWFWHASVGHAGTQSDTNIWDVSPLLQLLLTDEWTSTRDFKFTLDGQEFEKLWILADGAYPPIARFVKTIAFPIGDVAKMFAKWQEATRKDVERSFGVLTRKFQILARPIEYWDLEDIKQIISGCILMHNMMVQVRIERDEAEDSGMYHLMEGRASSSTGGTRMEVEEREAVLDGHVRNAIGLQPHADFIDYHVKLAMKRWSGLYSDVQHARLQTAMMNHVAANAANERGGQRSVPLLKYEKTSAVRTNAVLL